MDEFASLKKFLLGTSIDLICIIPMVLQVFYPGDSLIGFLGNLGYAGQVIFIWMALLTLPLVLLMNFTIRKVIEAGALQTSDPRIAGAAQAIREIQERPTLYRNLAMGRELLFCLVFSGFGWIWLAIGNLVALILMTMVWASPRIEVPEAA